MIADSPLEVLYFRGMKTIMLTMSVLRFAGVALCAIAIVGCATGNDPFYSPGGYGSGPYYGGSPYGYGYGGGGYRDDYYYCSY